MLVTILIGFLFGFIGSMPVAGPIAMLVLARSVEGRFSSGLGFAIGGAIAEAAYAFLAFWGFSVLLSQYAFIVPVSRAAAALILIGMGVFFVRRKPSPAKENSARTSAGIKRSIAMGFTITALNPTLLATWTAAATTLASTGMVTFEPSLALPFSFSVLGGIVAWFITLILLVRRYKERFREATLFRVVRAMGVLLIGIGLWFGVLFVDWALT